MFTMAKIRDGSTYLGAHLSANDYYAEHETVRGQWLGQGAERLGLSGEITVGDLAFEALRNNRHPSNGTKLTPRDRTDRIRFFDFQCGAAKSISILAVPIGDARLLDAHDQAAAFAFKELERFAACQANTAASRGQRLTGNVAAAAFRHTASRALDPQVHTHFVVANATWDKATKGWRALTEFEMLAAIRYAGKSYQNELARSCRRLGYDIVPARDEHGVVTGFEIDGVSAEVRERFSKRRAEIEAGIAAFEARTGREPTAAEIHAITVETRESKLAEITTPEVLARQQDELTAAEWGALVHVRAEAERRAREIPFPKENGREVEALLHAAGHLFERVSVAPGHALAAEALNTALGFIDHARLCAQGPKTKLVALDEAPWLHAPHAMAQGIALEQWAVGFANGTRDTCAVLGVPMLSVMDSLSPEQRRAVEDLLGSKDQVICLRGAAGVGKTTVLRAVHASLAAAGLNVLHCTPTTSAADTMRKEGLHGATTVRDFLCNVVPRGDESLRDCVLVVDEAGLASNRDGAEILQTAERWNARVLFVGDTRQHTAVEAGDFLRILENHSALHRVELDAIRRQHAKEYREAIQYMAAGAAREGLVRLDAFGWVHEHGPDYLHQAAEAVLQRSDGGARLDQVIAVTPTWAENHALTASIRAELKHRGVLHSGCATCVEEPLTWTEAQKRRAASYQTGMVVTFTKGRKGIARGTTMSVARVADGRVFLGNERREVELQLKTDRVDVAVARVIEVCVGDRLLMRANDRDHAIHNGDIVTVAAVADGVIRTTDGRALHTQGFRRFSHGFVVTSHKSQSKTAEHVVVAAARLSAKSAYVACSRGRRSVSLHVPAKEAMLKRLPIGNRTAALDLLPPILLVGRSPLRRRTDFGHEDSLIARAAALAPWCRRLFGRVAEWWQRVHRGREHDSHPQPELHR